MVKSFVNVDTETVAPPDEPPEAAVVVVDDELLLPQAAASSPPTINKGTMALRLVIRMEIPQSDRLTPVT